MIQVAALAILGVSLLCEEIMLGLTSVQGALEVGCLNSTPRAELIIADRLLEPVPKLANRLAWKRFFETLSEPPRHRLLPLELPPRTAGDFVSEV